MRIYIHKRKANNKIIRKIVCKGSIEMANKTLLFWKLSRAELYRKNFEIVIFFKVWRLQATRFGNYLLFLTFNWQQETHCITLTNFDDAGDAGDEI
jgi:hypothetical protein